jgi:hypothetical protein
MGVKSEHKWNEKVMSVPEGLKGLLTDLVMGSGIHEKHAKTHDVPGDTSCFCIMNLDSSDLSNLCSLNVEEAAFVSISLCERGSDILDIMGGGVENGVDEHRICYLSMEPLRFIKRQKPDLRSDKSQDIPTHWKQNHGAIYGKNETSAS